MSLKEKNENETNGDFDKNTKNLQYIDVLAETIVTIKIAELEKENNSKSSDSPNNNKLNK